MTEDVEKTLASELKGCKFAIQLEESSLGNSNILMAYVRYFSQIQKEIIDEFFFARFLKEDGKWVDLSMLGGIFKRAQYSTQQFNCGVHRWRIFHG
ncbi:UNVERIFIED_CONTAM: hypothetical protein RMT77_014532 [Armadillidium vulgare]